MVCSVAHKIAPPPWDNEPYMEFFAKQMKAPVFVAQLLARFGIKDVEEARSFFLAPLEETLDPYLLPDVARLVQFLVENPSLRMVVHGDYDVDGVCGTAILYLGLKDLGYEVDWFLPNRFEEGYGVHKETVQKISRAGANMLITVDTGITAVEEIALANELGLKVAVLDHHQEGPERPKADFIVNPHLKESVYPNKFLCGAGVAYKVLCALYREKNMPEPVKFLEFLVLGTLADIMPVVGENRNFLRLGMRLITRSRFPGLQELFRVADLDLHFIGSQDILFKVTPLINAAGRMGDPALALRMLLSESRSEAEKLVLQMVQANQKRKELEQRVSQEAMEIMESTPQLLASPVIVLSSTGWHQGVIGIVAARLVERYLRPVCIISVDEQGEGRASARSVEGFNWHKALAGASDLLNKWGGHYFAAGFSIDASKIRDFFAKMVETAQAIGFIPPSGKTWKTDVKLPFNQIDFDTLQWLYRFEPFGPENEKPLFYSDGVSLGNECRIVGDNHLRLNLEQGGVQIPAIAFGMGEMANILLQKDATFAIAFQPSLNHFRGQKTLQLLIKAIDFTPGKEFDS
jgi:single-stranded-DNA-specific exonuclease